MIPSILSQQLRQGVEDFLKTTFPVSTPFFHGIVDRLLSEDEGVFKGPFLSIQLPFRYGSWISTDENRHVNLLDSQHSNTPHTHPTETEKPQPVKIAANSF